MYDYERDALNDNEKGEEHQYQYHHGLGYGGRVDERESLKSMQQELGRAANDLKMGVEDDEHIRQVR